jgi:hypothetical protein
MALDILVVPAQLTAVALGMLTVMLLIFLVS